MASIGLKVKHSKTSNVSISRYGNVQVVDENAFIRAVLEKKSEKKEENKKSK